MKNYTLIFFVFLIFGGCSTSRKINKSSHGVKIDKDIESKQSLQLLDSSVKSGKTTIHESSTVEEINIKKAPSIELTANFKIDSTATLRGDTALKLVDVSDKNISITIYQNGKNGVLTAKIKSKQGTADVPFSEINIKKSSTNKTTSIDTSKVEKHEAKIENAFNDNSRVTQTATTFEKEAKKNTYVLLYSIFAVIAVIIYIYIKYGKK